jgi:cytochrome c
VLLVVATAALGFVTQPVRQMPMPAQALARQNNCFRCHSVEKAKDGPAWKDVAAKYKGKAMTAEQRLTTHLTTGEKAKFADGHEEEHKIIKSPDPAKSEKT